MNKVLQDISNCCSMGGVAVNDFFFFNLTLYLTVIFTFQDRVENLVLLLLLLLLLLLPMKKTTLYIFSMQGEVNYEVVGFGIWKE